MKQLFLLIFTSLATLASFAENSSVADTLYTDDVTISTRRKRIEKVAVGSKIIKIESSILEDNQTRSLAELLSNNSNIYIKTMGQGATSTASFRGTSSNHTQVLWNGISLNSAAMGSFDFSQIPTYFTDNVSLYYGSSAQQVGSGAIGGSVNFRSNSENVSKPYLSLLAEYGSNNTIAGGATFRISKGILTSSTRIYHTQSDNDFRYLNNVYSKEPFYEDRESSDYSQSSAMQEFFLNLKNSDKISFIGWWQINSRSLPQSIISSSTAKEKAKEINSRYLASYEGNRGKHSFKATLANLSNGFDYDKEFGTFITNSSNNSNSFTIRGDYGFKARQWLDIGSTIRYSNDILNTDGVNTQHVSRNTMSLRGYALFRASKRVHIDGEATFESCGDEQFAIYNLSARYMALSELLTLKASHSYNYRMPTLNDIYWNPGGNPELKPEKGASYDFTALYTPIFWGIKSSLEATCYYMDVRDWIMWVPTNNGSIWSPINFSTVISSGFELEAKGEKKVGSTSHLLTASYSYAHSIDNSNYSNGADGKQLPYIPRNKWNARYEVWWRDTLWANYTISYTGKRFTTADEEYYTNSYYLNNCEVGGLINLKYENSIKLSLKIDNLFNSYYESTQYYPMPLRMFRLGATYKWGKL